MKKTKWSFWNLFVKVFQILFIPYWIGLIGFYFFLGLIIDLSAYLKDLSNLDNQKEINKRATDRLNSHLHNCLDLIVDYVMSIFTNKQKN